LEQQSRNQKRSCKYIEKEHPFNFQIGEI